MFYYILCESEGSWERTIAYQTSYENFIVLIQQKNFNEKEVWNTQQHCMIPKIFLNFLSQLPDKPSSDSIEGSYITSGGIIPPSKLEDPLVAYDIANLPAPVKKILYKYDCDTVPFFENKLGVTQACDDLADLWGPPRSPESPSAPTPAVTPAIDPSPAVFPATSPSLFENMKSCISSSQENFSGLWSNLSGTNFETPIKTQHNQENQDTASTIEITPVNTENPETINAPKKRKSSTRVRELFENSD